MSDTAPKGESRSYVVGLPVLVTVWDDGTVVFDVATEEAGEAVRDDYYDPHPNGQVWADIKRIEDEHEARRERGEG